MNRGIIIAAIAGIGIGVAIPFLRSTKVEHVTTASAPGTAATTEPTEEPLPSGDANTESAAATQPSAPKEPHHMTEAEIVEQVRRENEALKGRQEQYFAHAEKERTISDKEFRQQQAQANIRAKENLASKQVQAQIDNASEYEYNPVHSAFGGWTADDWGAINHYSGGYIWGR